MKVVVFGEDMFTSGVVESLLEKGHMLLSVVTPDYHDHRHKRLEETALKHSIVFVKDKDVNSDKIRDHLISVKPDLIIAVHLRKILHKKIFSLALKGAINIHPSLLPKYRGLSPQHQAIMHGDSESGVTVHYINDTVDTGEIILVEKFPILKDEYILNIQFKMLEIYKRIVPESLGLLEDDSFKPRKQDLANVSYFGPLKKSDREIDLTRSVQDVYNLIRAVSLPYKGAFYKNYTIWAAEIPKQSEDLENKYISQGFYFDKVSDKVILKLKDGFLLSDDFEIE